jgi:DUF971 family protein
MPDDPRILPIKVKAPHGARVFEVTWKDSVTSRIDHKVLRGYCPCAVCQGHHGVIRFIPGGNVEIMKIERVGNYALGLTWADGHNGGIYAFSYLRRLGDLLADMGTDALCALEELPP